jgi:drug/metabolite transporter (DMT)-like permease
MTTIPSAWLSGMLGATASCMAKWAFQSTSLLSSLSLVKIYGYSILPLGLLPESCRILSSSSTNQHVSIEKHQQWWRFYETTHICALGIEGILRLGGLAGMMVCNSLMLAYLVQGMEESGSVAGTGLATAANFFTSALYGYLFWHDDIGHASWIMGFTCVLVGASLLSTVQVAPDTIPRAATTTAVGSTSTTSCTGETKQKNQ